MKTPDDIRDIASHTERTNQLNDLEAVQVALEMLERAGGTVQVGHYVGQVEVRLPGSLWQPLHELRSPK
jgi:hypothetical protein